MSDRFTVLTGGPGAGKTTLLDAMRAKGFDVCPEAGRAIIQDQRPIGGPGLPWADRGLFAELILSWELRAHREASARPGRILFDRGVPDVVGYLRLLGRPVPPHVHRAAEHFRYGATVFVAPPWSAIYTGDAERTQSCAEAVATHDAMVGAYRDYGYRLVPLPRAPVADRADFLLAALGGPNEPGPLRPG